MTRADLDRLRDRLSLDDVARVWAMTEQGIEDGVPDECDWPEGGVMDRVTQARCAGVAMLELAIVRLQVARREWWF